VEIENIITYEVAVQSVFLDYPEDVSRLLRNFGNYQRIRRCVSEGLHLNTVVRISNMA